MIAYDDTETEDMAMGEAVERDEIEPGELLKLHLTGISGAEVLALLSDRQARDITREVLRRSESYHDALSEDLTGYLARKATQNAADADNGQHAVWSYYWDRGLVD